MSKKSSCELKIPPPPPPPNHPLHFSNGAYLSLNGAGQGSDNPVGNGWVEYELFP